MVRRINILFQNKHINFKSLIGEEKIKADYDELLENMQAAFRNLED